MKAIVNIAIKLIPKAIKMPISKLNVIFFFFNSSTLSTNGFETKTIVLYISEHEAFSSALPMEVS